MMGDRIREEIDSFRSENGNNVFTLKELQLYQTKRLDNLIEKVDLLVESFSKQQGVCADKFVNRSTFWALFGVMSSCVGALASLVILAHFA